MEDEKRDASLSHDPIAYMGLAILLLAQWWISRTLSRLAERRWSGWKRACARRANGVFDGGGVFCYAIPILPITSTTFGSIAAGAAMAYAACAGVAASVALAVGVVRR